MGALLNDLTLFEHQNGIGVLNGGQAVGNDKASAIFHQRVHRRLDIDLSARVYVGGRLVKDKDGSVGQHGARNGDQLLLSLGDARTVIGKKRVIAVGQALDEGMDLGCLGGFYRVLVRSILFAVGDVFENGAVEQPGLLQYHGISASEAFSCDVADILAVNANGALVGIVKAHQKVDDSGLSRACGLRHNK